MKLKDNPTTIVVLGVSLVFFITQILLIWNGGVYRVFNSPDANANYHFAERIYLGEPLAVPLPFEPSSATNYLSTRSTRVVGSEVIPVSFIGLIVLAGAASKLLFINIIPYITPIAATVALLAVFSLLKRLFDERIALISTIALSVHPAWWFYTHESLLPNVLFVSLVIFGAYFLEQFDRTQKVSAILLCSVSIGLALLVRTSEILWIGPALIAYLSFRRSRISIRSAMLVIIPLLAIASIGYLIQQEYTKTSGEIGYVINAGTSGALSYLLPFGFHPRLILNNVWNYALSIFWPYSIAGLIGIMVFLKQYKKELFVWKWWFGLLAGVSLILILFYGSWLIQDHPDPAAITIGNSFVRYFLPIYILLTPFVARGLVFLIRGFKNYATLGFGLAVVVSAVVLLQLVFLDDAEGIIAKRRILRGYDQIAATVDARIPASAIVLTDSGDKYLWPTRLVMPFPRSDEAFAAVSAFRAQGIPLYVLDVTYSDETRSRISETFEENGLDLGAEVIKQEDISIYEVR